MEPNKHSQAANGADTTSNANPSSVVSDTEKRALQHAQTSLMSASGVTPLHVAAAFGHTETAKQLIDAGADLNKADSCGRTPLTYAATYGRIDVVDVLIEAGASPN